MVEISGWFSLMNQKPIIFYQMCLTIMGFQEYSIGQYLQIKVVTSNQMKLTANRLRKNDPTSFINTQFSFHAIHYAKWHQLRQ
jgi:hypothetical protein